ncbi:MAG: GNAT family N-acetyltransferase [Pirellulales bacterium]|nr:GNAT family N-acetyltransferase [Pirellulales bacterium]
MTLSTSRLKLIPQSRTETLAWIDQQPPDVRAQLSPQWLDLVRQAPESAPYIHGFVIWLAATGQKIGSCGFKGPPTPDGTVELAYGIAADQQNQGYATEAAAALAEYALHDPAVRRVIAHTLEKTNASARVLTKCGFVCTGQVVDPEDGLVWRWERGGGDRGEG